MPPRECQRSDARGEHGKNQTRRKRDEQTFQYLMKQVIVDAHPDHKKSDGGANCRRGNNDPAIEPIARKNLFVEQQRGHTAHLCLTNGPGDHAWPHPSARRAAALLDSCAAIDRRIFLTIRIESTATANPAMVSTR